MTRKIPHTFAAFLLTFFLGVNSIVASAPQSPLDAFNLEDDVKVLQVFFDQGVDPAKEKGQYKTSGEYPRRYVCFDMTESILGIKDAAEPLLTPDTSFGKQVYHNRIDKIVAGQGVTKAVIAGFSAEGARLFVRSSTTKFVEEYWALYQLLVPIEAGSGGAGEAHGSEQETFFALRYRKTSESGMGSLAKST